VRQERKRVQIVHNTWKMRLSCRLFWHNIKTKRQRQTDGRRDRQHTMAIPYRACCASRGKTIYAI